MFVCIVYVSATRSTMKWEWLNVITFKPNSTTSQSFLERCSIVSGSSLVCILLCFSYFTWTITLISSRALLLQLHFWYMYIYTFWCHRCCDTSYNKGKVAQQWSPVAAHVAAPCAWCMFLVARQLDNGEEPQRRKTFHCCPVSCCISYSFRSPPLRFCFLGISLIRFVVH